MAEITQIDHNQIENAIAEDPETAGCTADEEWWDAFGWHAKQRGFSEDEITRWIESQ